MQRVGGAPGQDGEMTHDDDAIRQAHALVVSGERVVVLTGAGISTDSGIPDFRGPQGVWTKNPELEKASTILNYVADDALRRRVWQRRLELASLEVKPNAGHRAVLSLAEQGRLRAVVTQNIDGLHQSAGHPDGSVIEVHGNNTWARCIDCRARTRMAEQVARVAAGDPDPRCTECGGVVKGDVILFGEMLDTEVIEAAFRAAEECDVLLAVGTTLAVGPVNRIVPTARRAGARVVILNGDPTEMDHLADVVVRGSISEVLPLICGRGG